MIIAVPLVTAVTTPLADPMVTTLVLALLHVPDGVRSPNVVVAVAQRLPPPVIADIAGRMVSVVVVEHPDPNV